jgi:hypothetical protein
MLRGSVRAEPIERSAIQAFDRGGQSFSSSCLAVISPIFSLAILMGTNIIAESLTCAFNLKEGSALSISASADIARV